VAEKAPPVPEPLGKIVDLHLRGVGVEGGADGVDRAEEDRVVRGAKRGGR
jgi:hypothetical protein